MLPISDGNSTSLRPSQLVSMNSNDNGNGVCKLGPRPPTLSPLASTPHVEQQQQQQTKTNEMENDDGVDLVNSVSDIIQINRPSRRVSQKMPSFQEGLFAKELILDGRAVMNQSQAGQAATGRIVAFIEQIVKLQNDYSQQLNAIIDEQVKMDQSNVQGRDMMMGMSELWRDTMEESRAMAKAANVAADSLMNLVEPMKKYQANSAVELAKISMENDQILKPFVAQQTVILKRQLKCTKLLRPMMETSFRSLSTKKQEHLKERARPAVAKYVRDIEKANQWMDKVLVDVRPRQLVEMQRIEIERLDRTRRILMRYSTSLHDMVEQHSQVSSTITNRLAKYHIEDEISDFVQHVINRPLVAHECLKPYTYRLPVPMSELGLEQQS